MAELRPEERVSDEVNERAKVLANELVTRFRHRKTDEEVVSQALCMILGYLSGGEPQVIDAMADNIRDFSVRRSGLQ